MIHHCKQYFIIGYMIYIYIQICKDVERYMKIQRECYVRMLVADGQGPSISYRKGPMYVSIYVQSFGRGSLNFLGIS